MDCRNARAGATGQTDAGDLAFRNVATRLLAIAAVCRSIAEELRVRFQWERYEILSLVRRNCRYLPS